MSGLVNLVNWVADLWNGNNKVQCVECGKIYTQTRDSQSQNRKGEYVNICGEACFSIYVSRKSDN